jgi:hypothetical protein
VTKPLLTATRTAHVAAAAARGKRPAGEREKGVREWKRERVRE